MVHSQGPQVIDESPVPPLEDDIETLTRLDRIRRKARELHTHAIERLTEILIADRDLETKGGRGLSVESIAKWCPLQDEPNDLIFHSICILALARREVKHPERKAVLKARREALSALKLEDLWWHFHELPPDRPGARLKVPVLQAARVVQALVELPDTGYSQPLYLALYCVLRELHSSSQPDWTAGSARATAAGPGSAFVTGECVRGIFAMARSIEKTATIIEESCALAEKAASLLASQNRMGMVPPRWSAIRFSQVLIGTRNNLAYWERDSAVSFDVDGTDPGLRFDGSTASPEAMLALTDRWIAHVDSTLIKSLNTASEEVRRAIGNIEDLWDQAEARPPQPESRHTVRNLVSHEGDRYSHTVALSVLKGVESYLQTWITGWGETAEGTRVTKLRAFAKSLRGRASATRELLAPARQFIQGVFDQQLALAGAAPQMGWDAPELVFAAASFVTLEGPTYDPRLPRAIDLIGSAATLKGRIRPGAPLEALPDGYRLNVLNQEVHRAMSQLLEKADVLLQPEFVELMMHYIEETAVKNPDESIVGWGQEDCAQPARASRWVTALSALTLDRIRRMLDSQINKRVLRHFSVRQGADLARLVTLQELFSPDDSLAYLALQEVSESAAGTPVTHYLEELRANLMELPQTPGSSKVTSLVLFGPPGTGKTTMVESLAKTACVPLVDVSPSDIAVSGAEGIERRVRDVFLALSYLSKCVIIFDEFDPVLLARRPEPPENPSMFTFVTPSLLPKLTVLNARSRIQNSVYVLLTNYISVLDDAAIRHGRFDERLGVYPPDLLSRAGKVGWLVEEVLSKTGGRLTAEIEARAARLVAKTAGGGMATLVRDGNFVLKPGALESPPQRSMVGYILGLEPDWNPGAPDADYERAFPKLPEGVPKERRARRDRAYGRRERRQWGYVRLLDESVPKTRNLSWSDITRVLLEEEEGRVCSLAITRQETS